MSDTPRTDAATWFTSDVHTGNVVEADFARQLERELATLRDAAEAAYKRIADRPRDAQWSHDLQLMTALADALQLRAWERYD